MPFISEKELKCSVLTVLQYFPEKMCKKTQEEWPTHINYFLFY